MNELIAAADSRSLTDVSTQELKQELAQNIEITARHLMRIAAVWRELERRGEDLSQLRSGLWTYMPMIAAGKLKAEIVVRYAGQTMLLRKISELSQADQDAVLLDDAVDFVRFSKGEWHVDRVPLARLKAAELSQVLSGRIVPVEEQRKAAVALANRGVGKPSLVRIAQTETGRIAGSSPVALSVPMTIMEKDALTKHASVNGVTIGRLVRAALISKGLLDEPAGAGELTHAEG